jgi:predicted outer membrane repeat protein
MKNKAFTYMLAATFLFLGPQLNAQILKVTSNADSGTGTLRELITNEAQNGDTIKFAKTISSITLTSGEILIDKDLEIKGDVVISGNNTSRIFVIPANTRVELKNLELTQGYSSTQGGAIVNDGTLHTTDVTFSNNYGNFSSGAIYNKGFLNVDRSCFTFNSSQSSGAIVNSGTAKIKQSTFANNSSSGDIGAILNGLQGNLEIEDSTFTNNSARFFGGAIYSAGPLNIDCSQFNNNTSGVGGAIYNIGALTIENSTFIENKAQDSVGGAIYNQANNVVIKDSTFKLNHSAANGGAIYTSGSLTVKRSKILKNISDVSNGGGGIYVSGSAILTVIKSIIENNTPDDIFPPQ